MDDGLEEWEEQAASNYSHSNSLGWAECIVQGTCTCFGNWGLMSVNIRWDINNILSYINRHKTPKHVLCIVCIYSTHPLFPSRSLPYHSSKGAGACKVNRKRGRVSSNNVRLRRYGNEVIHSNFIFIRQILLLKWFIFV